MTLHPSLEDHPNHLLEFHLVVRPQSAPQDTANSPEATSIRPSRSSWRARGQIKSIVVPLGPSVTKAFPPPIAFSL
ncbi:hypothetical protein TNCV_1109601 [Trichonephila clavipes]|nr:hypothetical protein TNCV_1109601 [Trichonephila clavipes]